MAVVEEVGAGVDEEEAMEDGFAFEMAFEIGVEMEGVDCVGKGITEAGENDEEEASSTTGTILSLLSMAADTLKDVVASAAFELEDSSSLSSPSVLRIRLVGSTRQYKGTR